MASNPNRSLIAALAAVFSFVCGYSMSAIMNSVLVSATRTVFVWAASVAVYYYPGADKSFGEPLTWWSLLQLVGFALLLLGECVYDGLVELPRSWFAPELEFDPRMSPVRIPTMTPSPHGFLIKGQFEATEALKEPLL